MIFRRKDNDGFGSPTIWSMITSPFRAVSRYLTMGLSRGDSIHVEQSLMGRIIGLVTLPFRFFVGFLVFMVQAWTSSRPGYAFVRAIPAMAVMLVFFIALLAADYIHNESRRIGTTKSYYDFQVQRSPDHPEYAEIFAEKLLWLQPENLDNRFELGKVKDRKGETYKALDIMKSLAPEDQAGYANAHIWLADYYEGLDEAAESPDDERVRRHLAFAIEVSPENHLAHFKLANLGIAELKDLDKSSDEYPLKLREIIDHLRVIADGQFTRETIDVQLAVIPKLVELQLELGEEETARSRLKNELDRLGELAERLPDGPAFKVRSVMVRAALSVKDYERALEYIREGQQLAKSDQTKRQFLVLASSFYLQRADDYQDMNDRKQYSNRLGFLCDSINWYPFNVIAAGQLLEFIAPSQDPADSAESKQANSQTGQLSPVTHSEVRLDWLRGAATDPQNMSVIHILMGINEVSKGNIAEAEKHWRIAERQNDKTAKIVNQLVEVAFGRQAEAFSNELDMISLAIELFPESRLYRTRGVFLQQLERYEEAIIDLKEASNGLPGDIFLHHNLIACYEKLGRESDVVEQQTMLSEKVSQLDRSQRQRYETEIEKRFSSRSPAQ